MADAMPMGTGASGARHFRGSWPIIATAAIAVLLTVTGAVATQSATSRAEKLRQHDVELFLQTMAEAVPGDLANMTAPLSLAPPAQGSLSPTDLRSQLRELASTQAGQWDRGVSLYSASGVWRGVASSSPDRLPDPSDPALRPIFADLSRGDPLGVASFLRAEDGDPLFAAGVRASDTDGDVYVWYATAPTFELNQVAGMFSSSSHDGSAYYLADSTGRIFGGAHVLSSGSQLPEWRAAAPGSRRSSYVVVDESGRENALVVVPVPGIGLTLAFQQPLTQFYGGVDQSSRLALIALILVLLLFSLTISLLFYRRRRAERRAADLLFHEVAHDRLTGVATRAFFLDEVEAALRRARRTHSPLALLYLDLDSFKQINDLYGHQAGDEVLRIAASRAEACLREVDMVGRLGGDEFAILVEGVASPDAAQALAARVENEINSPTSIDGRGLRIAVSIGIAWTEGAPDRPVSADELVRQADLMMYQVKRARSGRPTSGDQRPQSPPSENVELVEASGAYLPRLHDQL